MNSIEKILADLNQDKTGVWDEIPTPYILTVVNIDGEKMQITEKGVALKAFLNNETSEVKLFVAKFLEDFKELKSLQ